LCDLLFGYMCVRLGDIITSVRFRLTPLPPPHRRVSIRTCVQIFIDWELRIDALYSIIGINVLLLFYSCMI